jgi:glutamate carboxypeptidase
MRRSKVNRTRRVLATLALSSLIVPAASVSAQTRLNANEHRIAAYVDAHVADGIELLRRVVDINSGTMNFEGVRAVGDVFRGEFDALGFRTTWVAGDAVNRAGHLFAERAGTRGQRVLLIGHLDTVFEKDSPFQTFEMDADSMAHGPGIIDMKGGDVIIVMALRALKAAGALDGSQIIIAYTGDEELTGSPQEVTRRELIEAAKRSDIALGFEDGDADPATVAINRRGYTSWVLASTGTPAHSSQIFRSDVGSGAIYEVSRALFQFHERLSGEPLLTFNPGVIVGGTTVSLDTATESTGTAFGKSNVVAERAIAAGDLRAISNEQRDRAKAVMNEIAASSLPHTRSVLEFRDGYPSMAPVAGNEALLARLDTLSRALGTGSVRASDPLRLGAADVSFAAPYVKGALDGLGLAGADDHTVNEVADLKTFALLTKRAAVLIYRLTR